MGWPFRREGVMSRRAVFKNPSVAAVAQMGGIKYAAPSAPGQGSTERAAVTTSAQTAMSNDKSLSRGAAYKKAATNYDNNNW